MYSKKLTEDEKKYLNKEFYNRPNNTCPCCENKKDGIFYCSKCWEIYTTIRAFESLRSREV